MLTNITSLLEAIGRLINTALPIVIALGLLFFFYGLALFIFKSGDPEEQKKGRSIMIWGVVALFVMVSVWGLVRFLNTAFGVQQENRPQVVPSVQGL
jgi:hypothetical protein